MRLLAILVCTVLLAGAMWAVVKFSPLFLNSRIERIREKNLPRIIIEKGNIVYCRMKADDFRFPLPPAARVVNPVLTSGGFDTADGSVEVQFPATNQVTADEHENWLSGKVPVGGEVAAQTVPGGLLVKFHYFGDR
jgi:hypothetical protein